MPYIVLFLATRFLRYLPEFLKSGGGSVSRFGGDMTDCQLDDSFIHYSEQFG